VVIIQSLALSLISHTVPQNKKLLEKQKINGFTSRHYINIEYQFKFQKRLKRHLGDGA